MLSTNFYLFTSGFYVVTQENSSKNGNRTSREVYTCLHYLAIILNVASVRMLWRHLQMGAFCTSATLIWQIADSSNMAPILATSYPPALEASGLMQNPFGRLKWYCALHCGSSQCLLAEVKRDTVACARSLLDNHALLRKKLGNFVATFAKVQCVLCSLKPQKCWLFFFFCSSFLTARTARLRTVPVCSNHDGIVGPKLPLCVAF